MSAIFPALPVPIPMPRLEGLRGRVELALAERAVDWPFTRAASFQLDRALIRYEAPRTRSTMRGRRRTA